jgi:hypothetical protein
MGSEHRRRGNKTQVSRSVSRLHVRRRSEGFWITRAIAVVIMPLEYMDGFQTEGFCIHLEPCVQMGGERVL